MQAKRSSPFRVALISMPWSIFNRPSIQVASLKSFVQEEAGILVDGFHPYLQIAKNIGYENYNRISLTGWAGEALFAPLLFAEKHDDAERLYRDSFKGQHSPPPFDATVARIQESCDLWLTDHPLHHYSLIGFSLCFSQLLPSLYLARTIKESYAEIPIVFGGSSCSGEIGASLFDHFREIDYLVDGEGEVPLKSLCLFLKGEIATLQQAIRSRERLVSIKPLSGSLNLNTLPYPDYGSYFHEVRELFAADPFIPVLPLEFSRGCWWNKCTFCNLNLQWHNYRFKTGERMVEETLHLAGKYESLHFTFTDNALPEKEAEFFFRTLESEKMDFDFFAEIRGVTEPVRLAAFKRGGLNTVQVGIEALSSSLLSKMGKGVEVIDNIAVMKLCCSYDIHLEGNLITDFPTATEAEIAETLRNMDYVLPFTPLQPATFFLGHGSPVHADRKAFAIQAILPHAKNRQLFPDKYINSMYMLVNSYRGDRAHQHKLWQPVRKKIAAWRDFHKQRAEARQLPLQYRDGRNFLVIRQERLAGSPLIHRMRGLSRKIYLACENPVDKQQLLQRFPSLTKEKLQNFLDDMCTKRIMFQDHNRILSLAVHCHRSGRCP